ncbi:MAG: hypothetical protein A2498_13140 [Lentisphaerae bacterium RIFOXYC12_FULL_60_16]|nr:MAG: hypothetical protein A2498_13140 [Lentisphaerae bacterium RIFOXYC12_FULL_60_16]OGV82131.1 MAG: hypothetical protein A2340_02380 [Lentisphaerae bacterium RIFOXYB12_FULL_60_10]
MKTTTTWIVAVLAVVFFLFIFPELMHLLWHRTHKEPVRRAVCMNNLRQISLALRAHTNANQGAFPQRLGSVTTFCDHAKVFVCRGSGSHTGELARVDEWTDYSYRLPKPGEANGPMVWCNPKNHRKQGACVLFQNSSIVWVLAEDFERTIRTDGGTNQALAATSEPTSVITGALHE